MRILRRRRRGGDARGDGGKGERGVRRRCEGQGAHRRLLRRAALTQESSSSSNTVGYSVTAGGVNSCARRLSERLLTLNRSTRVGRTMVHNLSPAAGLLYLMLLQPFYSVFVLSSSRSRSCILASSRPSPFRPSFAHFSSDPRTRSRRAGVRCPSCNRCPRA